MTILLLILSSFAFAAEGLKPVSLPPALAESIRKNQELAKDKLKVGGVTGVYVFENKPQWDQFRVVRALLDGKSRNGIAEKTCSKNNKSLDECTRSVLRLNSRFHPRGSLRNLESTFTEMPGWMSDPAAKAEWNQSVGKIREYLKSKIGSLSRLGGNREWLVGYTENGVDHWELIALSNNGKTAAVVSLESVAEGTEPAAPSAEATEGERATEVPAR